MPNENQIRKIAQQVVTENDKGNQFGVSSTPFHIHNGIDSPRISQSDITRKSTVLTYTLFGTQAATAGNYSVFFTAPYAMSVSKITESHAVLGTDGGAVSLDIEKLTGTTAPGSGTKITSAVIDLKGTINTVVTASLSTTIGVVQLAVGDRLALLLTGTPTSVANVNVTLILDF